MFYAPEGLRDMLASVEQSDLPRKSTGQAIDTVTATRCYRHLKIRNYYRLGFLQLMISSAT